MSEIDRIVSGDIEADTTTTPREAFGVQMAMAYHTFNTDLFRDYSALPDMVADGFTSAHPGYRMVAAALMQGPRPKSVRLGRMTTPVVHTVKLTVKTATAGKLLSVTMTDAAGASHKVTRTVAGSSSLSAEATALALLLAALPGVASATGSGADITVALTAAGAVVFYDSLVNLDYLDETPDASIDSDITQIALVDDAFYGVTIAINSKANLDKVDAWAESASPKRLFAAQTADSVETQTGNSVIGAAMKSAAYTHTLPMYHSKPRQYMACAWLGLMLPKDAGSATFALKQLTGIDKDPLSTTQKNALDTCGLNYYVTAGSRGVTRKDGTVASGEKADIILGTDWLSNEIQVETFDLIAQADKIDFDDGGIAQVESVIRGVLDLGVRRNFLEAGNGDDIPAPDVQPLKVSDVDPADRADRLLSGVRWSARLRGAIHAVNYTGTLSV